MPFENLYHLKDYQIQTVYKQFALSFHDDDLYCALYQDEEKRKKFLLYFFKHYIKLIKQYCYFVSDSVACNSVMIVFDSKKESKKYAACAIWFIIKTILYALRIHSIQGCRHTIALWDMFTSRWVNDFVTDESYHMDLLYTKKEMRGFGLASKLIKALLYEADIEQRDVTMETHHKDNLSLYEHVGFKRMGTITHEYYKVTQYNLLYRAKEVE